MNIDDMEYYQFTATAASYCVGRRRHSHRRRRSRVGTFGDGCDGIEVCAGECVGHQGVTTGVVVEC